jgi:sec-independent protein translocase protein TatB
MGFGEFAVLLVVALMVLGPKDLPRYLRKAGLFVGRARDWANDMRRKSGIDDILRAEGLDRDIAELRKLTRGELTSLIGTVRSVTNGITANDAPLGPYAHAQAQAPALPPAAAPTYFAAGTPVDPEREFPSDGADSYGAVPDMAVMPESPVPSAIAEDPVYARGEAGPAADTPLRMSPPRPPEELEVRS